MSTGFFLRISGLLPNPLRERLSIRESDVWMQDLKWEQREQIFVQAASGTGKTTLMHSLYGLRNDFAGQIFWAEQDTKAMTSEAWSRLRQQELSLVFQDLRLFPELSAFENLEAKRVLANYISTDELKEWMDLLGISDRADKLGATLSYGEQQRLAIIRSLLQPFKFLLLDEPFSHLDSGNIRKAAALIAAQVQRNGATLILADLDDNDYFPYTLKLSL